MYRLPSASQIYAPFPRSKTISGWTARFVEAMPPRMNFLLCSRIVADLGYERISVSRAEYIGGQLADIRSNRELLRCCPEAWTRKALSPVSCSPGPVTVRLRRP